MKDNNKKLWLFCFVSICKICCSLYTGASLYIDCGLFDDDRNHFTIECEPQCPDCHQMDVATRLMIARPNKGPHFKVTHMAIGDITLYEKYHEQSDVKSLCGSGKLCFIDWYV